MTKSLSVRLLSGCGFEPRYCHIDNKVAETLRKKYTGSFKYRLSFKSEWTDSHPAKAIKSEK